MGSSENITDADIRVLLNTIINQNNDIKKDIEQIKSDIATQCQKIDNIGCKVVTLENENKELNKKLIIVERKLKTNNIIIFGIEENILDLLSFVKKIIIETLEVKITDLEINNIYRIGQKSTNKLRPVKLELVTNLKKQEIFREVSKLKNTGIVFSNDLLPQEREEQKVLRYHLKTAREKQYNAKIVKNKLVINGDTYSYEDLKKQEQENTEVEKTTNIIINAKINSAPSTPVTQQTFALPLSTELSEIATKEHQVNITGKGQSENKKNENILRKRINNCEEKEHILRSSKKSKT